MRRISVVIFFLWVCLLFFRSTIYSIRIVDEFLHPTPAFLPEITACSSYRNDFTDEELHVFRYRHYGGTCAK